MATPTKLDIQAVKDAMAKTPGLNYVDAARQVRGVQNAPVATTPTTPIVPTPVPTSPLIPTPTVQPITNQEVQQGVNAVGGTAEQRRQTRTDITAGQTVVSPTPVEPVSPTPVSTTPTEKTPGITQDAFQQAKIESEKIKAQNDAVMAQNKQKSELARQDEAMKAEALMPKDEKSVLNALISGIGVPKQNTQAYRNAEVKSNNYRKYASMTPTQLLDNMKMGQISTEMDQLLASNPNYAQAKQKLNEFQKTQNLNKTMSNIVNGMKGKEVATVTPEQDEVSISDQLMKKYGLDDANASAFAQFVATDEEMADNKAKLLANKNALSSVNRQINETTTLLNQGIKDLKAQYPDMPASGIITLMGSRLSEFNDAITNLNSTKSLLTADIKDGMDLAKSAFDAKSADIQAQNQIRSTMALNEYKSDFEKQQAEAALNDPATAIKSVMDEYKKLGIPFTSTVQSRLAEFKASGKPLTQFLTDMTKNIQESPGYKAYAQKQGGTEWQSTNITRYNPATGANESTPVFYRKKTDGSFEAVDLSGNKIDASLIGGGISGTPGAISASGDMSGLASNYPYEASFKNNNTSGITWGMSARTKGLLEKAGIKISEGTARPSREGGKYVKFDNIADGLLGHKILLSQAGSDDINARLQQWVGTKEGPTYAKNLMDQAGIKAGTKFSQLTPEQLDKLVMVQIKKESPGMYKELTKTTTETPIANIQTYDPNKIKSFEAFNGTTFPSDYKTPIQQKQFREEYDTWRASRPGIKIEKGSDIQDIKLDKPTEGELESKGYTSRMIDAVNNILPLEKDYADLSIAEQLKQQYLPGVLKSDNQKLIDTAKKNFITAVLRKQSGASIAPSEFAGEEIKYFPQPGDSKKVIIAKQNARNAEIKAMLVTAGTDIEGNSLSKYYNPPVIIDESTGNIESIEDRLKRLRNK